MKTSHSSFSSRDHHPLTVVILAAGYGTRMGGLTQDCPKPLLKIFGVSLLEHILRNLSSFPIEKILINTHYLPDQITAFVEAYQKRIASPPIVTVHEPEILETGGVLLNMREHLGSNPFLVLNGDIFWQPSEMRVLSLVSTLRQAWREDEMDVLLTLIPHEAAWGYAGQGDFFWDEKGRIDAIGDQEKAPFVYGGVQMMHPRLLEGHETGFFSCWTFWNKAHALGRMCGTLWHEPWFHVGTKQAYDAICPPSVQRASS